MFCKINTAMIGGINGVKVIVECDIRNGMPMFNMIGGLASEVREAKDRVITAMINMGFEFPIKKITVNLAPAHLHKRGNYFDLPIAIAILGCMEEIRLDNLNETLIIGELGLNGKLRKSNGVLSIADMAYNEGFKRIILPKINAKEAAVTGKLDIIGVDDLREAVDFINDKKMIEPTIFDINDYIEKTGVNDFEDFQDVSGQDTVKRAVEIAASGRHNLLMIGSPGSGKSMISKRIPGVLPALSIKESIEISKIYSVCGMIEEDRPLILKRPFRAPHHTVSAQAMAGGGRFPMPGEVSLSHNGVLFLDEFPEFQSRTLEILRQPMEDKKISISRALGKYTYPANFQLIAAMNPCPCGYFPDRNRCNCNENDVNKYLNKISGPMLDRIDICVEAKKIGIDDLNKKDVSEESSIDISKRVAKVHKIQKERFKNTDYEFNSQILPNDFEKFCKMTNNAKEIINTAFDKYQLTARGYHKIIRVARTIADADDSAAIEEEHISEALFYRTLDFKYWR